MKATSPVKRGLAQRMPHTNRERQEPGEGPRRAGHMPGPGQAAQASDYHSLRSSRGTGGLGSELKVKTPFQLTAGALVVRSIAQD